MICIDMHYLSRTRRKQTTAIYPATSTPKIALLLTALIATLQVNNSLATVGELISAYKIKVEEEFDATRR